MGYTNLAGLSEDDFARVEDRGRWVDAVRDYLGRMPSGLLIDNEWVEPAGGHPSDLVDPSTGSVLGRYWSATPADVDHAIGAAAKAQQAWGRLSIEERGRYLRALREKIAENRHLFETVDSLNAGLSLTVMAADLDNILRVFELWPGLALSLRGEVLQDGTAGLHYTEFAPYGVVARIAAYNHPLLFSTKGTIAALLAGNAVVLKPAEQAPASALVFGQLVREVLPPGVFNIVTGPAEVGDSIVRHPAIRRIAFTGSVRTGQAIQRSAAEAGIKNVSLELGGKNAMIVFPDVDVQAAAESVVYGMNLRANAGQSCGSTSRLFIHDAIYDRFLDVLANEMGRLTVGPAYDPSVDMGPVISKSAAKRIEGFIASATEEGARLVFGGDTLEHLPAGGSFVSPALFADTPLTSRVATEEIFGPVIASMRWTDRDDMLAAVNALGYGLTASIWTQDIDTALSTARAVESGYVWVNDSTKHYFGMPFGGWKDSGIGREECMDELRSYLEVKAINVKLRG
jgi:acyl-CoA reductase-like NAD-dependent aldehyde dehydrogenase